MSRRRGQRGQALVETTIVMPVMIFTILGAVQLMMMMHARVMTEYSAYCAARAGIVHNANWNIMRNAATVAVLPIYRRTDNPGDLARTWLTIKLLNEATELVDTTAGTLELAIDDLLGMVGIGGLFHGFLPDVSLVEVDVTSPLEDDIEEGLDWQDGQEERATEDVDARGPLKYPIREVDFDDQRLIREHPEIGRLAVETRVLVPLKIPLVNQFFFYAWYAQEELRFASFKSSLQQWAKFETEIQGGAHSGKTLEQAVQDSAGTHEVFNHALLTSQRTKEARALRDFAAATNMYLIPMRASYAMQMQSNPFWGNRRQPVWFDLSGGG